MDVHSEGGQSNRTPRKQLEAVWPLTSRRFKESSSARKARSVHCTVEDRRHGLPYVNVLRMQRLAVRHIDAESATERGVS